MALSVTGHINKLSKYPPAPFIALSLMLLLYAIDGEISKFLVILVVFVSLKLVRVNLVFGTTPV